MFAQKIKKKIFGSKNNFLFEISGVPEQKVADKTAGAFNHPLIFSTVSPR